jgi:hypothetical protein
MMRDTMRSPRIRPLLAAMLLSVTWAAPVGAQQPLPSITDQPSATLLLPYFEVDLANPAGANTLFTINNASASAILAHVTLWSTMHVPVHTFNVYLTGYDSQPIYVRDVINGALPQTASAGQDPLDAISPKGVPSQDINFATCTGQLPYPALPAATIAHIKAALTGQPSALAGGLCASISDGTQIAKGYITVDTVNNCTTKTPADAGYFASGGSGDATNQNTLWGDYVYTNHLGGLESSDGSPLVHIRANATDTETSTPGNYTFYGRLVGWTAVDNREPLSTSYAVRFVTGSTIFTSTNLTVWRDAKTVQSYFACNGKPSWYPLGQEGITLFDEQEHPAVQATFPFAPQPPSNTLVPFPAGAQRVTVGSAALPSAFSSGWIFLDFNTTVTGSPNPPEDPAAAQAWVDVHMKGNGRYSVGWPGIMLDTAKATLHVHPQ